MLFLLLSGCLYISDQDVLDRLGDITGDDTGDTGDTGTPPVGGWYPDLDADGSGDASSKAQDDELTGYVQNAWDCDDADMTEPVWVASDGVVSGIGSLVSHGQNGLLIDEPSTCSVFGLPLRGPSVP